MHIRDLAEALLCFDLGKSLYRHYVLLVVTIKFPELYHSKKDMQNLMPPSNQDDPHHMEHPDEDDDNHNGLNTNNKYRLQPQQSQKYDEDEERTLEQEEEDEFDIDATRSQLSSLFHRVCAVCTLEFQLMAHVFTVGDQQCGDFVYLNIISCYLLSYYREASRASTTSRDTLADNAFYVITLKKRNIQDTF